MKHTINSLFSFLRNPKDEKDTTTTFSDKLKAFALLFGFEVFVMMLLVGLINLLDSSGLVDLSEHEIGNVMEELPIITMLLMGVVVVPFLEELIFRLALRYERNIPILLMAKAIGEEKMLGFWQKNYRFIFYFSALCFGYAHIFNFGTLNTTLLLFSPLLILPQFFMGSVAGYLRVRFGFMWSYALHFCHNLLFIGGAVLAMNVAVEKVNISTDKYDIKIEEIALSNVKENFIVDSLGNTSDSLEIVMMKNYNISDLITYLLDDKPIKLDIQHQGIKSLKYNVEFKAKQLGVDKKASILNEFSAAYKVRIDTENRLIEKRKMIVIDSTLLFKYVHNEAYESFGIKGNPFKGETEYSNVDLKKIATFMNQTYDEIILTHIDMDKKFDLTLPVNDFQKLSDVLENKYGIGFITTEIDANYTVLKKAEK